MIKQSRGFTLIELMIVIAIVGILSLMALPHYRVYIKKAYISEGLRLFNNVKLTILEHQTTHNILSANNFLELGFHPVDLYEGQSNQLAMKSPLKYIKLEKTQYFSLSVNMARFTLVFDKKFDTKRNELVIEMYPIRSNNPLDDSELSSYHTYCYSYLRSRPKNAIQKEYLPAPCKPSETR